MKNLILITSYSNKLLLNIKLEVIKWAVPQGEPALLFLLCVF